MAYRNMKRYLVAFASALVGVALTVPYAVLNFREPPPIAPKVANGPPREMTLQEMLFISECCVVFYAGTYFAGKRIYAAIGTQEDIRDIRQFSGGHMRLLHCFAGAFMVASFWAPIANRNPWARCLSLAVGLMLLASGAWEIAGWLIAKIRKHSPEAYARSREMQGSPDEPANLLRAPDEEEWIN